MTRVGPRSALASLALIVACLFLIAAAPPAEPQRVDHHDGTQHEDVDTRLLRLIDDSQALARYEEAAELAEQFAARFPRDPRTPGVLAIAYTLRLGLGHEEQARATLAGHDATHRQGPPHLAVAFFRERLARIRYDEERLAQLQVFLARHQKDLERDERLVAEVEIARLQWRQSCYAYLLGDLCLAYNRGSWRRLDELGPGYDPDLEESWDERARRKLDPRHAWKSCLEGRGSVIPRHGERRKQPGEAAQRRFSAVLAAAERVEAEIPEHESARKRAFMDAVAMAALYAADRRFEEVLALTPPTKLRFAVDAQLRDASDPKQRRAYREQTRARADSLRRVQAYLLRSDALAEAVARQYEAIVADGHSTTWTIAALARLGQLADYRLDMILYGLAWGVTDPEDRWAACGVAQVRERPLYARSTAAFKRCLELSAASGEFNEFSEICEAALARRERSRYVRLHELVGVAEYTASRPESIGVQEDPGLADDAAADGTE